MFKSLLGATVGSLDSLILTIFIVLAVVLAGSLVVYFLWEAVSSLSKKSKDVEKTQPDFGPSPVKEESDGLVVVDLDNLEKAPEQKEETEEQKTEQQEELPITEVDEQKAEEEKSQAEEESSEEERLNAERRAYLEARRQELIRRMQEEMSDEDESENESEEESDEQETSETEEVSKEEEQTAEEQQPAEEVKEEQVDQLEEERSALNAEKQRYEAMVKELEEAKKALAATQTVEKPVVTNGVLSLEELKERLEAAEKRLAKTEKEFKQCKKEYIPLRKIWTAYERDQKKLRRKEALVARQKVLLYGVNNFADIDEEKAKKLSEDLDHLDGLKLSVQHCQEVMAENAERYPLLEKMYGVLSQRNEELKN